jgi:hypothetical protein
MLSVPVVSEERRVFIPVKSKLHQELTAVIARA